MKIVVSSHIAKLIKKLGITAYAFGIYPQKVEVIENKLLEGNDE